MKDIGTVTIAFAAISVVCVLIICFGFLTPLLTEGMPIVECTAKGGCLHCSRYACRHVRDFGWRLQKEIKQFF